MRKNYKDRRTLFFRGIDTERELTILPKNKIYVGVSNCRMKEKHELTSRKILCLIKMMAIDKKWTLREVLEFIFSDFHPLFETALSPRELLEKLLKDKALEIHFSKPYGVNCPICGGKCEGCPLPLSEVAFE